MTKALAALHLCILTLATAGFAAVQVRWRPPFLPLWDTRATLYFDFASFILALIASLGLAGLRSWPLPSWLRALPTMAAVVLQPCVFMGLVALSAQSTPGEVGLVPGKWVGLGVGLSLVAALISNLQPKDSAETEEVGSQGDRWRAVAIQGLVAVVATVALLLPRDRDDPQISNAATFASPDRSLQVGTTGIALTEHRYGVVKIIDHGKANALVLEPGEEWRALQDLWTKAVSAQGPEWRQVGDIRDTNPSDRTRLVMFAGPGVRLIVDSPHGPTVSYQLAPADLDRFGDAVTGVGANLK